MLTVGFELFYGLIDIHSLAIFESDDKTFWKLVEDFLT